jgi:2,5-diketo-D-gluconate reductase A
MRGVRGSIDMPLLGIGTWQYNDSLAERVVVDAFRMGYRHVDTAYVYKNQVGVGAALATAAKDLALKRADYFVTSKIAGGLNASATGAALEETLRQLQLDYVDLMLIHWPASGINPQGSALRKEQWLTFGKFAKEGKARAIGVSHHCRKHLEDVLSVATLPVALNQNQYHVGMGQDSQPRLHDKSFDEKHGIIYMSYSSLCGPCTPPANMELITGDLVTSIGRKHNKTGAQVALRWVVQQNIPIIPKSTKISHMRENMEVFDLKFKLSPEEMQRLSDATSPKETGTKKHPDDAQDCAFEELDSFLV